mgnify:CR=1 FL=1
MRAKALCVMAALWCIGVFAAPAMATPRPVKAAVVRSTGTYYLGQTIWRELNAGWSQFGETPVQIDYTSLAGFDWTVGDIAATGADVLILSAPGYLGYSDAEIDAIIEYVHAGHGIIYTYGLFRGNQSRLAPLVGIGSSIKLGTGTSSFPVEISALVPEYPLFHGMSMPYTSGVPYVAHTSPLGPWPLDGGTVVANLFNGVGSPMPSVILRDSGIWRGLYFAYYVEAKSGGANAQDMQVFYNALLWTPEPATLLFVLTGASLFLRRKRRR